MTAKRIQIDLTELVAEAEALLAAARQEQPEHRLVRVAAEVRRYKALVVQANAPRGYRPDRDEGGLRKHREAFRASGSDLMRVREWLRTRSSVYLLGGTMEWRLDDLEWEVNVWSPLFEWVERGYSLLFDGSGEPDWPRPVAAREIEAWEASELELEWRLLGRVAVFLPTGDCLALDPTEPHTVRWRDVPCFLGNNDLFRIMELLVRAGGRTVQRERVAEAVGDEDYTDDALRKACSRLRERLRGGGLGDLADRIKTSERGRYVYIESSVGGPK